MENYTVFMFKSSLFWANLYFLQNTIYLYFNNSSYYYLTHGLMTQDYNLRNGKKLSYSRQFLKLHLYTNNFINYLINIFYLLF